MAGTVDVTIVPVRSLVLYVSRVDGDTTGLLFGGLVDLGVVGELGTTLGRQDLGDSGGQRRLTVIDVTYKGRCVKLDNVFVAKRVTQRTYQWCRYSCAA